jgi:hypothetical protein
LSEGNIDSTDGQNPLSFNVPADIEGDVGEAVEQVSNDIMASSAFATAHSCH